MRDMSSLRQMGSGDRMMSEEQIIFEALDGLAAGFNAHDIDVIMGYFAEDCSLDLPRGSESHGSRYIGRDQVRRGIMSRFQTTPDVRYTEVEHFANGRTGMSKWLLTGTNIQGVKLSVRGCDFYTFNDCKVTRKDSYWKIVD